MRLTMTTSAKPLTLPACQSMASPGGQRRGLAGAVGGSHPILSPLAPESTCCEGSEQDGAVRLPGRCALAPRSLKPQTPQMEGSKGVSVTTIARGQVSLGVA